MGGGSKRPAVPEQKPAQEPTQVKRERTEDAQHSTPTTRAPSAERRVRRPQSATQITAPPPEPAPAASAESHLSRKRNPGKRKSEETEGIKQEPQINLSDPKIAAALQKYKVLYHHVAISMAAHKLHPAVTVVAHVQLDRQLVISRMSP